MMLDSTTMLSLRSISAVERMRSSASSRCRISRASTCRMASDVPVTVAALRRAARVDIDAENRRYRRPLEASAVALAARLAPGDEIVLLGSIASPKYVDVLTDVFGERLLFPRDFVGRGDMSRGGLLLRCVRSGQELTYVPVRGAVRSGRRPPKLEPATRNSEQRVDRGPAGAQPERQRRP